MQRAQLACEHGVPGQRRGGAEACTGEALTMEKLRFCLRRREALRNVEGESV